MKKEKNNKNSMNMAVQAVGASTTVNRYGSAVKEHLVSYSGADNEAGTALKRGLKKTHQSRVNTEYKEQNLRQQSGFAAEDKYTARENAKKILSGSKNRTRRTDDLGRVNDPFYDHIVIDKNGVEIFGSGEQMKFVGNSPKNCLSKILTPKYQKYIDADAKLVIPSDYYTGVKSEITKRLDSYSKQLERAQRNGDEVLIEKISTKINKLNKIDSLLKDSGITNAEALEARLAPKWSTAKDVGKLAHQAGVKQAKAGVLISGGISLIRNVVGVCKGEKSPERAARDLAVDCGIGAAIGYLTGFAGSAIKGAMQNAKADTLRIISKTNAPALIVTSTIEIGQSMRKFVCGEITGVECLTELGEKGTSNLSAALFAGVGQIVIPIPVVGSVIGSMMGYALSSSLYGQLVQSLIDEKLSLESRLEVEKECKEAINLIEQYRHEVHIAMQQYFRDWTETLENAFSMIEYALASGEVNTVIKCANNITKKLGCECQFETLDEFDQFINNKSKSLIL